MSIRPVDYTSLVPKSQEVSKIKQIENHKFKVQVEQGVQQQDKQINKNLKKVRDTNKSENLTVDVNKKKKDKQGRGNKRQKNKKKVQIKTKENLGVTIDIKI